LYRYNSLLTLNEDVLKSKTKYIIYFNQNINKAPKLLSLLSIPYKYSLVLFFYRVQNLPLVGRTTFWNSFGKRAPCNEL